MIVKTQSHTPKFDCRSWYDRSRFKCAKNRDKLVRIVATAIGCEIYISWQVRADRDTISLAVVSESYQSPTRVVAQSYHSPMTIWNNSAIIHLAPIPPTASWLTPNPQDIGTNLTRSWSDTAASVPSHNSDPTVVDRLWSPECDGKHLIVGRVCLRPCPDYDRMLPIVPDLNMTLPSLESCHCRQSKSGVCDCHIIQALTTSRSCPDFCHIWIGNDHIKIGKQIWECVTEA